MAPTLKAKHPALEWRRPPSIGAAGSSLTDVIVAVNERRDRFDFDTAPDVRAINGPGTDW
jgi:hypothetical protein